MELNDLIRNMVATGTNDGIAITEDGKTIRITMTSEYQNSLSKLKAAQTIFALTKGFTIFKEFAERGYDFSVSMQDLQGTLLDQYNFSHSQYSTWTDMEQLMKFLDQDLPEATKELEHRAIGG